MANDHPLDQSDSVDRWVQTAANDRKSFGQLFDFFYPQIFAYCSAPVTGARNRGGRHL